MVTEDIEPFLQFDTHSLYEANDITKGQTCLNMMNHFTT